MNKIKLSIIVLLACIILCGCAGDVAEGTVVDKYHTAAHSRLVPMYTGRGYTYITQFYPDCYYLKIKGVNGKGEEQTTTYAVGEGIYYATDIGDYYKAG